MLGIKIANFLRKIFGREVGSGREYEPKDLFYVS